MLWWERKGRSVLRGERKKELRREGESGCKRRERRNREDAMRLPREKGKRERLGKLLRDRERQKSRRECKLSWRRLRRRRGIKSVRLRREWPRKGKRREMIEEEETGMEVIDGNVVVVVRMMVPGQEEAVVEHGELEVVLGVTESNANRKSGVAREVAVEIETEICLLPDAALLLGTTGEMMVLGEDPAQVLIDHHHAVMIEEMIGGMIGVMRDLDMAVEETLETVIVALMMVQEDPGVSLLTEEHGDVMDLPEIMIEDSEEIGTGDSLLDAVEEVHQEMMDPATGAVHHEMMIEAVALEEMIVVVP